MAEREDGAGAAPVPSAPELMAVGPDGWARLLRHARAALHELEGPAVTPEVARLRAAPTSRLAAGRMRERLALTIAEGGALWRALRERMAADDALPDELRWLLEGGPPPAGSAAPAPRTEEEAGRSADDHADELDRLRARARAMKDERDEARRRLTGAEARAEAAEAKLADLQAQLERERHARAEAEAARDAAADLRRQAVERERRRMATEIAELEGELRRHRKREQERRARERAAARSRDEQPAGSPATRPRREPVRVVAGRPTRLPPDVRPGTAEAARLLLGRGRRVLVDGYNVTLTHRPQLDLERQRDWLVQLLAAAAARFGIRPMVVFDGERGRPSGAPRRRGVEVRFSAQGVTADDELVFTVESMEVDEPVVVVTDDAELGAQLRARGADVLGTRPFLWAVG